MSSILADLRFALRSYRRTPLIAIAVVLTLALGIGAVGAIFSVVNAPNRMYMLVKSQESETTLHPRLREAVWSMDPTLAVSNIQPMEKVVVASASRSQLLALLLAGRGETRAG